MDNSVGSSVDFDTKEWLGACNSGFVLNIVICDYKFLYNINDIYIPLVMRMQIAVKPKINSKYFVIFDNIKWKSEKCVTPIHYIQVSALRFIQKRLIF